MKYKILKAYLRNSPSVADVWDIDITADTKKYPICTYDNDIYYSTMYGLLYSSPSFNKYFR